MKIKIHFKNILSLIFIIAPIFVIALFINSAIGNALIFILLGLFFISPVLLISSFRNLKTEINVSSAVFNKDEFAKLDIAFNFNFPLALFIINAKLYENEFLLTQDSSSYSGLSDKASPLKISVSYRTTAFGKDKIGIKQLILKDFMNIISISLNPDELWAEIKTLPRLNKKSFGGEIINNCLFDSDFDDSQEITAELKTSAAAAGFEHREYFPGDSLKRINWKLSAKKGELLVRLDEPSAVSKLCVILDNWADERLTNEKAVEAMLSFVDFVIKNSVCCDVYICTKSGYNKISMFSSKDMKKLLDFSADAEFYSSNAPLCNTESSDFSSAVIFTSNITKNTMALSESLCVKTNIITASSNSEGDNIYHITPALDIKNSVREASV